MAIDTGVPRTRRALLAGGVGGLAAIVASALGRPLEARAGSDGDVVLGATNTATTTTGIIIDETVQPAFWARSRYRDGVVGESVAATRSGVYGVNTSVAPGYGVFGRHDTSGATGFLGGKDVGASGKSDTGIGVSAQSESGHGVHATSTTSIAMAGISTSGNGVFGSTASASKPAILGRSSGGSTGVAGISGTGAPADTPPKTGVYGWAAQDVGAHGVTGQTLGGRGVNGLATSGVGAYGYATTGTGVIGASNSGQGVRGVSSSSDGVRGDSASAIGVLGTTGSTSRPATAGGSLGGGTGVLGYSGGGDLPAGPPKTGMYGYATQDAAARGVTGESTAGRGVNGIATTGRGVHGQATTGRGVHGQATSGTAGYFASANPAAGYALRAIGRVRFDKCAGVATIAAGHSSITVTPGIDLVSTSAVVATLQGNAGGSTTVKRVAVSATANSFTIHLTANASANVKVAWIVIG